MRVGIDEAGYGPRLGPLEVGLVAVRGVGDPLGELIDAAPKGLPRIADSKKVKQGPKGFMRLETTALAAYAVARGRCPTNLAELLNPGDLIEGSLPWLQEVDLRLPVEADGGVISDARSTLADGMASRGAELAVVACATLSAEGLNRRVDDLGNKARVEQEMIEGLLGVHLPRRGDCSIVVDRLGGRHYYEDWLSRVHPFCPLTIESEASRESRYRVKEGSRSLHYAFLVDGESHSSEVALASCVAKYQRELIMVLFNRYWCGRHPDLRPTAGYETDARRFLAEIEGDEMCARLQPFMVRTR